MSTITIKHDSMVSVIAAIRPLVKKGVKATFAMGCALAGENVNCQVRIISENGTEQIDKGFYAVKPADYKQGELYMRVNVPADVFVNVAETLLGFEDGITFCQKETGFSLAVKGVSEVAVPIVPDDELSPAIAMEESSVLFGFSGDSAKVAAAIKKGSFLSEDCDVAIVNTVPFLFNGSDLNKLTVFSTYSGTSAVATASVEITAKRFTATPAPTDAPAEGQEVEQVDCLNAFMKEKGMSKALFPIPASVIPTISSVIRGASKFDVFVGKKHVKVKTPGIIYTFTLGANCAEGIVNLVNNFSNMTPENVITVDNDGVLRAIDVCRLNNEKKATVTLQCSKKTLLFENEKAKTAVPATEGKGLDRGVRLDLSLLKKAVSVYPKGNLTLSQLMQNNIYITVVRSDDESDCTYILPIQEKDTKPESVDEGTTEE